MSTDQDFIDATPGNDWISKLSAEERERALNQIETRLQNMVYDISNPAPVDVHKIAKKAREYGGEHHEWEITNLKPDTRYVVVHKTWVDE